MPDDRRYENHPSDLPGEPRSSDVRRLLGARTAAVAGTFLLLVAALLAWNQGHRFAKDPSESARFQSLKEQLAANPQDNEVKEQIRQLDLELRRDYFRRRELAETGAWLLLGGGIIFLLAFKTAAVLGVKPPAPAPLDASADRVANARTSARLAVIGSAAVLAAAAAALVWTTRSQLPQPGEAPAPDVAHADGGTPPQPSAPTPSGNDVAPPGTAVAEPVAAAAAAEADTSLPTDEEVAANWPRFRGPGGLGIAPEQDLPDTWDAASGEGIVWKSPVPLPGNSSPVIWGDYVFLTGADETAREVYCFRFDDGQLLWKQTAPSTPQSAAPPPEVMDDTGFAPCTAASDGRRVYAMFANGDVVACDFTGAVVWSRSFGIPKNTYGHAASLLVYRNLLVVLFDQGSKKDSLSKIYALDSATGKTAWEQAREVPNSWTTPIVANVAGKPQLITAAEPWVIAYDPDSGEEIWRGEFLEGGEIGPSPTVAGGLVYVANDFPCLSAIRADGAGDVTDTHLAWEGEDGLPNTCSPLATEEQLYLLSDGLLTCYDAKEGNVLWELELDDSFYSSPTLVGKRLYIFGREGGGWIVEPTPEEGKIVGQTQLGEECVTSPAVVAGRMVLRGKEHLFCIGKK